MTSGKCGPLMSKTKKKTMNRKCGATVSKAQALLASRADHRVELGQAGTGKNLEHLEQFGALCAARRRQQAERYLPTVSIHLGPSCYRARPSRP